MPKDGSHLTSTSDVQPIPLIIGKNGRPIDPNENDYDGIAKLDGWHYTPGNNDSASLTIYENCSVDFGESEIDWKIDNYGIINGGIFTCKDSLTNEETGKIESGEFNTAVRNFGTIDDGMFNFNVSNYGIVNNGTFSDHYSNTSVSLTNPDNTVTRNYGLTNGGVFSQYASFYNQPDIKLSWVTLDNCSANGISGIISNVWGLCNPLRDDSVLYGDYLELKRTPSSKQQK